MPNITISLSKAKCSSLDERRKDKSRYAIVKKLVEDYLNEPRNGLEERIEDNHKGRSKSDLNPFLSTPITPNDTTPPFIKLVKPQNP